MPITLESIAAYERMFGADFTIWERRVLCLLDDAVTGALNSRLTKRLKTGSKPSKDGAVSMSDGGSMKSLFRSLAASKKKANPNG